MKPAILLENVTRSFGHNKVLRGVSACVTPGKVVGLLGRNGEGKTTLIKLMLDLLAVDTGCIQILGMSPDGTGAIRRRIGYVPERPVFHEFMTVGEVFTLRSRFFKGWKMEKAQALAGQMDLGLDTNIQGASKGTLGKTAWVCAAAHDPELFLLDEPTSGLDALVREDLLRHLIAELHETGKTIFVANHRMEELTGVLDEIWVLARGVLLSIHQVETLRTQACCITGRIKEGSDPFQEPALVLLSREGPLFEWAALDRETADRVAASGRLENLDRAPLPIETTLKLLLKAPEGGCYD